MLSRVLRRPKSCASLCTPIPLIRHQLYSATAPPHNLEPLPQNEHQSFRIRTDGKSKPLPLPPVLDSVVLLKRALWEQRKRKPNVEKFTAFQRKLWENPYAHVLASPPRQCRNTFLILPSSLLITLHARPHPDTLDPWLLPVNLTTTKGQLGTPYRFLGRKLVAQQLGKKTLWKGGLYARFAEKLGPTKVTKMVWREDMADLILSLLRKNLLNKLKWHFKHSGQLVPCDSPHSKDIDGFENVSCVLYFGTLRTSADELQERALTSLKMVEGEAKYWAGRYNARMDAHMKQGAAHIHPVWYRGPLVPQLQPRIRFPSLEFKTTVWRDSRVAVYSLQDLLGEEMVGELMKGSKWEMEKCVIVKRGRHNVPLETMLMQSQAYVATAGP